MRSFLRLNSWHFLRDLSTRELSRQEWGQNQPTQPAHTWNFTTCVFVCTYSMHSRLERRKREVSEYFKIDVGDIGSRLKNEVSSRCRSLCRYMSQHACRCSDINSSSIAFPLRCALPLCMLALCRVIVNSFTYASHALTIWNVCCEKRPHGSQQRRQLNTYLKQLQMDPWQYEHLKSLFHSNTGGSWDSFFLSELAETVCAQSRVISNTTNTTTRADATLLRFRPPPSISLTPSYCHSAAAFED